MKLIDGEPARFSEETAVSSPFVPDRCALPSRKEAAMSHVLMVRASIVSCVLCAAMATQARAQMNRPQYISPGFMNSGPGASTSTTPGQTPITTPSFTSTLMNPLGGTALNPLMNPYVLSSQPSAATAGALYFMSAQQAYGSPAGSLAILRSQGLQPTAQSMPTPRPVARAMSVPGASAASYFGRVGVYSSGMDRYYNRAPSKPLRKSH